MNWRQWFLQAQDMLIGNPRRALVTLIVVVLLVPPTRGWLMFQLGVIAAELLKVALLALIIYWAFRQIIPRRGRH